MTKDAPQPGIPCWIELATNDRIGAAKFYQSLFGWEASESPMGPDDVYVMLRKDGRDIGALYQEKQPGTPPHWTTYFAVASADESAEKAKSLGGNIVAPPFDVMDAGRMAVVIDPAGAAFCLWEGKRNPGTMLSNAPGSFCWSELMSTDAEAARKFYSALFGWEPKVSPEYTEWSLGGRPFGGLMDASGEQWKGVPSHWMPYFSVASCAESVDRIRQSGGQVCIGPHEVPNVGIFAVVNDPQAAAFSIIELKMAR